MRALLPAILVASLAATGCVDPRAARVADDADAYISGVQYRDAVDLIKHQAPFREAVAALPADGREAARNEQIRRTEERLAEYDEAKVTGVLPLAPDGIDLIQALAIGKGIFYSMEPARLAEDGRSATAVMDVNPDYGEHRFRGLPPGTRVYVMGEPLGTVRTIVLGESAEEQVLRLVDRIRLEWRFRWFDAVDVYPEGWAVESVRPVPDSVRFAEIRRVF